VDDRELIQRCINKDNSAWNKFIGKYSRLIYNYIHSVFRFKGIPSNDPGNISDLFQDLCHSLIKDNFKKLKSFKGRNGCSFASWLRQVVINYTLDYIRRCEFKTVSCDLKEEKIIMVKERRYRADSFIDRFLSFERLHVLKYCIDSLSTDQKFFLELYLNQNLKLEDLRKIFKISRGAVDMRKSRIIELLKDCFRSKGFELE